MKQDYFLRTIDRKRTKRSRKGVYKYTYRKSDGSSVNSKEVKEIKNMVKELALPPAWNNVKVYKKRTAKVRAKGYDVQCRPQSIYNDTYVKSQKKKKFTHMKVIGRNFEDIEKKINSDISRKSDDEQFKIAMILKLIITCNIRIGDKKWLTPDTDWVDKLQGDVINNEIKKRGVIIRDKVESKKEEEERKKERIREDARKPTYGASTLKEDHIISQGDKIKIKFTGKSGVENECVITDKKVGKALKELKKEASGDGYLFKVEGDFISPKKINDYLGPSITSKNLRTWICNVEYIKYILQNKRKSKEGNEEIVRVSTKNVSEILHNTPGVCKSSYIHSGITKRFLKAPDDFVAFFTKNGKINKTYIREKYLKFLNRKSRKQRRG